MKKANTVNKGLVTLAAASIFLPLTGCNKTSSTQPLRAKDITNCILSTASYGSKTMNVALRDDHYSFTVELSDKSGLRKLATPLGLAKSEAEPVIMSRSFTYYAPEGNKPEYQLVEKTDKGQIYSSDYSNRLSADARHEGDTIYTRCVNGYNIVPHIKLAP